ncbi:hypothetical protein A2U01_0100093, partial [Trifolium medium]|nr:hypothetical protein [Trifolium medium]
MKVQPKDAAIKDTTTLKTGTLDLDNVRVGDVVLKFGEFSEKGARVAKQTEGSGPKEGTSKMSDNASKEGDGRKLV